jgi:cytochrome c biogenesis protein CcdA
VLIRFGLFSASQNLSLMKLFISRFAILFVFLGASFFSFAQQPRDYQVQLRAGVFVIILPN